MGMVSWTTAWCVLPYLGHILAAPEIALPFNAQVPTVARVGVAYRFTFSDSTFSSSTDPLVYSLSQNPPWLVLEAATRTLSGTPGAADVGARSFTLTAADSSGATHMDCTLVISADPSPRIRGDVVDQLTATTIFDASPTPPVITLQPAAQFAFEFRPSSFVGGGSQDLYYYATLADHTPLPAWLHFDSSRWTFSGLAPDLASYPLTWDVKLCVSDVPGFSGDNAEFQVSVGTQEQLIFVPRRRTVRVESGEGVEIAGLRDNLFLNGRVVTADDGLRNTEASSPTWLEFDPDTWALRGVAPQNVVSSEVTVSTEDAQGNAATAVVDLVARTDSESLFAGTVDMPVAVAGQSFDFRFPDSLFAKDDLVMTIVLPPTADWLDFDPDTRTLQGDVPRESNSTVRATLVAERPDGTGQEEQDFQIQILPAGSPTDTRPRSSTTPSPADATNENNSSRRRLAPGAISGIVVGVLVATALLVSLLICCRRRMIRRTDNDYVDQHPGIPRHTISRPIVTASINNDVPFTRDIEKSAPAASPPYPFLPPAPVDPPPQISLNLPSHPSTRRLKWSQRFSRISHVSSSSLATGEADEATIIRNDANIPEWPADAASLTALPPPLSLWPSKAAPARPDPPAKSALRHKWVTRSLRWSAGLGIEGLRRRESRPGGGGGDSRVSRATSEEDGHRRGYGGRAPSPCRSVVSQSSAFSRRSVVSPDSALSPHPSAFPHPPTISTTTTALSRPRPRSRLSRLLADRSLAGTAGGIRLVDRSNSNLDHSRSGTANVYADDYRDLVSKRQSFIRQRASSSHASPLFAHGSRVSSAATARGVANSTITSSRTPSSTTKPHPRPRPAKKPSHTSSLRPRRTRPSASQRFHAAFPPSYPRAISSSPSRSRRTSASSPSSDNDPVIALFGSSPPPLIAQLLLPRAQRPFVLPGEASPTPEPELALRNARRAKQRASRSRSPSQSRGQGEGRSRIRSRSSSVLRPSPLGLARGRWRYEDVDLDVAPGANAAADGDGDDEETDASHEVWEAMRGAGLMASSSEVRTGRGRGKGETGTKGSWGTLESRGSGEAAFL